MSSTLKLVWECFQTPSLYRIYKNSPNENVIPKLEPGSSQKTSSKLSERTELKKGQVNVTEDSLQKKGKVASEASRKTFQSADDKIGGSTKCSALLEQSDSKKSKTSKKSQPLECLDGKVCSCLEISNLAEQKKSKNIADNISAVQLNSEPSGVYQSNNMETYGDILVAGVYSFYNYRFVTAPIFYFYLYKYEYWRPDNWYSLVQLLSAMAMITFSAYAVRAYGRAKNPKYEQFLQALKTPQENRLIALRNYDFEFSDFPTTFVSSSSVPGEVKEEPWYWPLSLVKILGLLAVHTFGIRMLYPGSLWVVQFVMWADLVRGRAELVEQHRGERHKIKTHDNNSIDCMFVDNRGRTLNGNILVICCEGNSGFYEVGIMGTPLAGGYSVLGWNHPGFAGSTGTPYQSEENAAVDAVMQFALQEQFQLKNIVLFGWSIGGYSAAWAAAHYPEIRCAVLDATFEDLLPLALVRMPPTWAPLVTEVVRKHIDLNVAELLLKYPGEVRLVRRTLDEIICLRDGVIGSNACNGLLLRLLQHRHSDVVGEPQLQTLRLYLSADARDKPMVAERIARSGDPLAKTALALITQRYLKDYESTHCTPLPLNYFSVPVPTA